MDKDGTGDVTVNDLSHRYLWGPAVDQILADEIVDDGGAEDVLWTLTDHLNTVRDLAFYDPGTDTTMIANHRVYDAFGTVTDETYAAVDCLFAFTGRPYDEDTGLQNNLHRWYDPKVGSWISQDPIGFTSGTTNLYVYCGNSPTNGTDPYGACFAAGTLILMAFERRKRIEEILPGEMALSAPDDNPGGNIELKR